MMTRHAVLTFATLCALVAAVGLNAQEEPPVQVTAPNAPEVEGPDVEQDVLVLDDMETEPEANWHDVFNQNMTDLVRDEQVVKQGAASGRWEPDSAARYIFNRHIEHDWSEYGTLAMWLHSEAATGATMLIILASDSEDTEPTDFYRHVLKIDWEGWRDLRLAPSSFQKAHEPVGWEKIDTLRLSFEPGGFGEYAPGTVLHFDDIRLLPAPEDTEQLVIFDSDVDWGCMGISGGIIGCVLDPEGSGERVARWEDTLMQAYVWNTGVPEDWSDFAYLNMWIHAAHPDELGEFLVMVDSENPDTEGQDSYQTKLPLDWEGWKLFSLSFADMQVVRQPLGGDHIQTLKFYTAPYCKQGLGTTLLFGDMWLSTQPPEATDDDEGE